MHHRRQHDQHMKDIMRAADEIKPPRPDRLRAAGGIEESPQGQDATLEEVVGHARGAPHVGPARDDEPMRDGDAAREAEADEGGDAQFAVLLALEVFGMDDEDGGEEAEDYGLAVE